MTENRGSHHSGIPVVKAYPPQIQYKQNQLPRGNCHFCLAKQCNTMLFS